MDGFQETQFILVENRFASAFLAKTPFFFVTTALQIWGAL